MISDQSRSRKQEDRAAKRLGGTRNSGSGNGPYRKNDVRTETESLEYKTTLKNSFRLTNAELLKAEQYALLDGREMAFGIDMDGQRWIVISENYYETLRPVEW